MHLFIRTMITVLGSMSNIDKSTRQKETAWFTGLHISVKYNESTAKEKAWKSPCLIVLGYYQYSEPPAISGA